MYDGWESRLRHCHFTLDPLPLLWRNVSTKRNLINMVCTESRNEERNKMRRWCYKEKMMASKMWCGSLLAKKITKEEVTPNERAGMNTKVGKSSVIRIAVDDEWYEEYGDEWYFDKPPWFKLICKEYKILCEYEIVKKESYLSIKRLILYAIIYERS